jgi:hypothetical protein
VGVDEGHVRRRHAIVPRNVREPSKEVSLPRHGDVDRPHRLASTRQSSQHRSVLQTESHLADGEVERVCLWSPPVHERGDQRGVVVELRQPLRSGTSARSLSPSTNHATGRSPATHSLKKYEFT